MFITKKQKDSVGNDAALKSCTFFDELKKSEDSKSRGMIHYSS